MASDRELMGRRANIVAGVVALEVDSSPSVQSEARASAKWMRSTQPRRPGERATRSSIPTSADVREHFGTWGKSGGTR